MSEQRYDPYTGQPIQPQANQGYKYDPYTGQPIQQQAPGNAPQGYNGQPQGYNAQQSVNYPYNQGMYAPKPKSGNKALLFTVIGVVAVAVIALAVVGGFWIKNLMGETLEAANDQALAEASIEVEEEVEVEIPEEVKEEPEEVDIAAAEISETPIDNADKLDVNAGTFTVDENSLFAIKIGEYSYQIPQPVKDFLHDGWTFADPLEADEMIGTGDRFYTNLIVPNGDKRTNISVSITNFSLDAVAVKDGYICDISFNDYLANKMDIEVTTLGGKVKLGESTKADVEAAYGKPDSTTDSSSGGAYFYYGEEVNYEKPYVMVSFDENGVVDIFGIRNAIEPENFVQTEVSDEVPAYLSKYEAPKELGDDPFSGNFTTDGVVYNLPVPLQVLVDNGWTYDLNPELSIGAGEEYVMSLHKKDMTLTLNVANFDAKATKLKNTIVVMISSHNGGLKDGIEFSAGLNVSMTEKQLLQWFKDHGITDHEKLATAYSVPFKEGHGKYEIFVSDGEISFIQMRNYGWLKD